MVINFSPESKNFIVTKWEKCYDRVTVQPKAELLHDKSAVFGHPDDRRKKTAVRRRMEGL